MWDQHLDGLIVTGREPLAANLMDEPYWETFTRVARLGPGEYPLDGVVVPGSSRRDSSHGWHHAGLREMISFAASSSARACPSIA